MRILQIRPEPRGSGSTVARFDVQITDEIRLLGLKLIETRSGALLCYAPTAGGLRTATFAPALAERLTRAASAAFSEGFARDRSAA